VALERAGRGTPAERLSVALGQTKEECKKLVQAAKRGEAEAMREIWEAIQWRPANALDEETGGTFM
jgi:hypothetical protein